MTTGIKLAALAGLALGAGIASGQETITFTNVNSNGPVGNAVNELRSFSFTNSFTLSGAITVTGNLRRDHTGTFSSEARIRVTSPGAVSNDLQPFTANLFTSSNTIVAANRTQTFATFNGLASQPGTWGLRFFESFDDGGTSANDAVWDTVSLAFGAPLPPVDGDRASTAIDLGNLDGRPMTMVTGTLPATTNQFWFKFTHSGMGFAQANSFFDIFTSLVPSGGFDTEIGVYDSLGNLIGTDDDDAVGLHSLLTFGTGSGQMLGDAGDPGAGIGNGRDGNGIGAAGTYFICVSGFNAIFNATNFNVVSGAATGNYKLNIIPAPGSLALLGVAGLIAGRRRR